jgi:diaminopimelate decarboxylase
MARCRTADDRRDRPDRSADPARREAHGRRRCPRIVFGPTCDSVDRLPGEIPLPVDLAEGDFVVWQGMGSYSTVTNTRFNGFGELQMATVLSLKL